MQRAILPPAYLGNIFYYANLVSRQCIIDRDAHYIKQTYANRCRIITSNGTHDLIIPVVKPESHTPLRDIRISDHLPWQQLHWRAIESAYSSSPFFEYFRDDYMPFFEKKQIFLIDFNMAIQQKTLELLNFKDTNISLSDHYIKDTTSDTIDYRETLNPKKFDVSLYCNLQYPYYQVFDDRFGFTPNLSVIDLLFNMGNEARIYLRNIIESKPIKL